MFGNHEKIFDLVPIHHLTSNLRFQQRSGVVHVPRLPLIDNCAHLLRRTKTNLRAQGFTEGLISPGRTQCLLQVAGHEALDQKRYF